jgi:hypothetical protein
MKSIILLYVILSLILFGIGSCYNATPSRSTQISINSPIIDEYFANVGIYMSSGIMLYYSMQTMAYRSLYIDDNNDCHFLHNSTFTNISRPVAITINDNVYIAQDTSIYKYSKYGDILANYDLSRIITSDLKKEIKSNNFPGAFQITDITYSGINTFTLIYCDVNLNLVSEKVNIENNIVTLMDLKAYTATVNYGFIGRVYEAPVGLYLVVISKTQPYRLGQLRTDYINDNPQWVIGNSGWTINDSIGVSPNTYKNLSASVELMRGMMVVNMKQWIVPSISVKQGHETSLKLRLTEYYDELSGLPEFQITSSKEFTLNSNCKSMLSEIPLYIESLLL